MSLRFCCLMSLWWISLCGCGPAVETVGSESSAGTTGVGPASSTAGSASSGNVGTSANDTGDTGASAGEVGTTTGAETASGSGDSSEGTGSSGGWTSQCSPFDVPTQCDFCLLLQGEVFACVGPPPGDVLPIEDGCGSIFMCPEHYACVGEPSSDPIIVKGGECVPLCDVTAPECPDGLSCSEAFPEIHVGFCV